MSTAEIITLDSLKAAHDQFAQMIQRYEAQPIKWDKPMTVAFPTLNPGERWLGAIISANGAKHEHIILLPGSKTKANWSDAMAWAQSIGGELPDRTEGALMFATMKDEFEPKYHWLREQYAGNSNLAWAQHFDDGSQSIARKDDELPARAVRRLVF